MTTRRCVRWVLPLVRGASLRCPVCGKAPLFRSYNRVIDKCRACGADFHASPGEWTGALMFAQGFFGLVALGGWYLLLLAGMGPSDWRGIVWLIAWGVVAPLVAYPSFKGAWIGAMYAAGGLEKPGENTRP